MNDPTEHWPRKWREDFKAENQLLEASGEELLHPREYLECRYDDACELLDRNECTRAQWRHDVLRDMLNLGFSHGLSTMENGDMPAVRDIEVWRNQTVDAAREIADRAYPPPVKP